MTWFPKEGAWLDGREWKQRPGGAAEKKEGGK